MQREAPSWLTNAWDVLPGTRSLRSSASSPADPIFGLHHANIDRLWAQWQTAHPKAKTPHTSTLLQPPPLFGVQVASQLDVTALGYRYACTALRRRPSQPSTRDTGLHPVLYVEREADFGWLFLDRFCVDQ